MCSLAQRRLSRFGARASVITADITQPFAGCVRSNFIASFYLLDLLSSEDASAVVDSAYECLEPGGRLGLVSISMRANASSDFGAITLMSTWQRLNIIVPLLLGGCRPVALDNHFPPANSRWLLEINELQTTVAGYTSQILVARRR